MPKKSCRLTPRVCARGRLHGVAWHHKKACSGVHDYSVCGSKHVRAERYNFTSRRDHRPERGVRTECDAHAYEFGYWRYAYNADGQRRRLSVLRSATGDLLVDSGSARLCNVQANQSATAGGNPGDEQFHNAIGECRYDSGSDQYVADDQYDRCDDWKRVQSGTNFGAAI